MTRMTARPIPRLVGAALLAVTVSAWAEPASFVAVSHDGGRETIIGHVAVDDRGRISIRSAETGHDAWLRRVAARANGKQVMSIDVPPPDGSPRHTEASRNIRRGDPTFVPALKDYLVTYYDLELRPE
jgi:hypothetical protein